MADIRLYKQFYLIEDANLNSGSTYNLIDPFFISASTYSLQGTGTTYVESYLNPIKESTGVYYVDLDPYSYSCDVVYEINWFTNYVENSPQRRLPGRFRISPNIVGNIITTEIYPSTSFRI